MEMIYDKDTNETVKIFSNPSHICGGRSFGQWDCQLPVFRVKITSNQPREIWQFNENFT